MGGHEVKELACLGRPRGGDFPLVGSEQVTEQNDFVDKLQLCPAQGLVDFRGVESPLGSAPALWQGPGRSPCS